VPLSYLLTLTVFLALVGRLTDIFGRRWFFIGFSVMGTIGTIVAATAQSVPALIGGFVLIGAAAGAGLSFFWVVSELVPMRRRFIANSALYFFTIPFTGLGAKVSSSFLQNTNVGWRGPLYLMTAINGVGTICWFLFYHPPTFGQLHRGKSLMKFVKDFDYVGFILFTAGTLLFLMGLSWVSPSSSLYCFEN
jgi:MFS family permease